VRDHAASARLHLRRPSCVGAGPYEFLFALAPLFTTHVPALHPRFFALCGVPFSDKALTYALLAQMAWNQGWRSAALAAVGAILGGCYTANVGWIQSLRLPAAVRNSVGR